MHQRWPRHQIIVWLLIVLCLAAFLFGLGSFVSHATITLSGSSITGDSFFNAFTVPGTPPASSSSSLLELGPNAISGSASGTFIGANPSSFSGDFLNFQVNSSTKFAVDTLGDVGANEFYGSTVATPYPDLSFTSTGGIDVAAGGTNQDVTLSPSGSGASIVNNLEDKGGQVYNVEAYGVRGDEKVITDGVMTSGSAILTSATADFSPSDVGKSIVVPDGTGGGAGDDLETTIASYQSSTQVTLATAASNTVTAAKVAWGTDNTTAINNLLSTVYNNGGGTIYFPAGSYLTLGQIVVPNDGASPSNTKSFRITGAMGSTDSYYVTTGSSPAASTINLLANVGNLNSGTYGGKIQTDGAGTLEVDHIAFEDTGSDCGTFLAVWQTTVRIHDDSFDGTHSGTAACNGGINLGRGTTGLVGYGTYIVHNYFSHIQTNVWVEGNAVTIEANTTGPTCGGTATSNAAYSVAGGGNYIAGNLIEDANYTVAMWDDATTNNFSGNVWNGNATWDASGQTYAYYVANPRTIVILGHDDEISRGGISHLFWPGSVIPVGAFSFGNLVTTLAGTSAGHVYWSTPVIQNSDKRVILNFQGYENTSTIAQTVNVTPVDFAYAPNEGNGCPSGLTVGSSTVTLPTSMGAAFTGQCVLEGQ